MKPTLNLNINFKLIDESVNTAQIFLLKDALTKLSDAGITIAGTSSNVAASAPTRTHGPNEALYLQKSGMQRMRMPRTETDREAYAAHLLKTIYNIEVSEATDTIAASSETDADNEGLI